MGNLTDNGFDRSLVEAAIGGDVTALQRLLWETRADLLRYVQSKVPAQLRQQVSAEDVVQETHRQVFRQIGGYRPEDAHRFGGWLCTIAKRRLVDAIRREQAIKRFGGADGHRIEVNGESVRELIDQLHADSTTPSRIVSREETVQALLEAIEQLPDDHRQAVTLRYLEGRAPDDVANTMGKSKSAINSLCFRGIRKLRLIMGDGSQPDTPANDGAGA